MFKAQEELRSRGFEPKEFLLDGKIHRFDRGGGKKSAWYIGWLHFSSKSGEQIEIISYGDWRTGEKYEWSSTSKLSADDRAALNRRAKEAAKAAEEERQQQREAAALLAKETWDLCQESGGSPYLERKRIKKLYGARTQMGENYRVVVVPMWDSHFDLRGLQRIFHTGKKYFLEGQQVKGLYHLLPGDESRVFVAEGYATAVTIHEATGCTVYVAFQASNLESVAVVARKEYPGIEITICGDDDRRVKKPNGDAWNPGREAATAAARKISSHAVFPAFQNPDSEGTDFNDLFIEEGPDAVREILCPSTPAPEAANAVKVRVLGRDAANYFLISSTNRMLTIIPRGSMTSPAQLLSMAPIDYWRGAYGENKNGSPDWQLAASVLMSQGNTAGIFSPLRVRGRGVWMDRGRVVVHQGDRLLVDGTPTDLMAFDTEYVYEEDQRVTFPTTGLSAKESALLVRACQNLPWRNREHAILAAGWLALCRVSGALPWRPHVWFTGEAGSGKTTLRDMMLKPAAGNLGIPPASMSTESGIRQYARNASLAVLFDEAEAKGKHKTELISAVLDLARMASSESDDVILKGTPGGSALVFRSRGMYAMLSIRVGLEDAADISRFAVMELQKGSVEQFKELRKYLAPLDQSWWDRLARRSVALLPKILSDYQMLQEALADKRGARFGQQYGMLLAGFCTLTSDEPITMDVARQLANSISLEEEIDRTAEAAPSRALDLLLDHHLSVATPTDKMEFTILQLIQSRRAEVLIPYGIDLDSEFIYIRTGEGGVAHRVYSRSEGWTRGWADQLLRIDGAKRKQGHRFGNRFAQHNCVAIPLTQILA